MLPLPVAAAAAGILLQLGPAQASSERAIRSAPPAAVALYAGIFLLPSRHGASSLAGFIRPYVRMFDPAADTAAAAEFKPERLAEQRLEEIRFQQTLA